MIGPVPATGVVTPSGGTARPEPGAAEAGFDALLAAAVGVALAAVLATPAADGEGDVPAAVATGSDPPAALHWMLARTAAAGPQQAPPTDEALADPRGADAPDGGGREGPVATGPVPAGLGSGPTAPADRAPVGTMPAVPTSRDPGAAVHAPGPAVAASSPTAQEMSRDGSTPGLGPVRSVPPSPPATTGETAGPAAGRPAPVGPGGAEGGKGAPASSPAAGDGGRAVVSAPPEGVRQPEGSGARGRPDGTRVVPAARGAGVARGPLEGHVPGEPVARGPVAADEVPPPARAVGLAEATAAQDRTGPPVTVSAGPAHEPGAQVAVPDLAAVLAEATRHAHRRGDGAHRMVVRLDPPELGTVHADVVVRGEEVHVALRADAGATAPLREARDLIERALRGEGFMLGGFDVSARDDGRQSRPYAARPDAARAPDGGRDGGPDEEGLRL